ncbi:hypothetical protein W97_08767 [Coniosporium apollinis CBS 100218]|uniref:Peptide chain release factor domain-containing protein n=1 Tax=Coniosporium apollinis (strain CBS 100218) TaxID=1168221 RepID=R7Z5S0_CONA1|nr:uncharacterized protein W97_08767 [Coniosporium apollinis CBS 100218]EON69507.1 hypothetical protein W97_08767 [Coniosporium apollinis CBS 100218]
MSNTPWICHRCLLRAFRPFSRRYVRYQSTAAAASEGVSPALLTRARSVAAEHGTLSKQLAEGFDTRTAKKVGELSPVASALKEWEYANESLAELRNLIADSSTDAELRSLASEDLPSTLSQLSQASHSLTTSLVPKHPFANLPCLIEIRPGAGGSEAALFAGDLLRMYQSYCARNGLRCTLLKYEDASGMSDPNGSDAPLQEAILEVQSEGAYGIFRSEAGVHRVQRVPVTESKGRTHTSAASVLVLPNLPAESEEAESDFSNPESDYYIDPKDVRMDIMKARGAGGQHVNTTESAVRLTHIPTNTVVAIQDSRSQPKNREKAWGLLRSRIAQSRREAREEETLKLRRSVVGVAKMGRGDKIRTYNWGQQRVTDHRSGLNVHDLNGVIEGGDALEKVMQSVRSWLDEREIEAMTAEESSSNQ